MKTFYRNTKTFRGMALVSARLGRLALFAALTASAVFAQDSSGDGLLNGKYRFRYIAAANYNSSNFVSETFASYGVIDFSNGAYAIDPASQVIDNTVSGGRPTTICVNETEGNYQINAAGLGYITNPFTGGVIVGEVTNGVFIGSSTESTGEDSTGINDLFIAILPGAPPPNSSFTSPYWIGDIDFTLGTDVDLKNSLFEITPNGSGSLGSLSIQGQANNQPGTPQTQSVTGATYNFAADGNAQLKIPLPSGLSSSSPVVLITPDTGSSSASRSLYVSQGGNFVLGWNPNGYDILFGVKALTGSFSDSLYKGMYYTAGLADIPQSCGVSSYWGSLNADGMEDEVEHQRLLSPACSYTQGGPVDYGTDNYTALSNGVVQDEVGFGCVTSLVGACTTVYGFGAGETSFVSISNSGGTFSLNIGIQPQGVSPTPVFLDPTKIFNAASWDPVTTSVAPGELITLQGSNLSPTTLVSTGGLPFPTSLGGVQVLINGNPAPIYYVRPTQISVLAPYGLATLAQESDYTPIQVNNNGQLSNQASAYLLTDANSGIFALNQGGFGEAVAVHATSGAYVTEDNPAQPGEIITLALTGMGAVSPAITDGAVGPSTAPLSEAVNFTTPGALLVLFNDYTNSSTGNQATVQYAGLFPGLAGLYQMNVTVPTTVGPGDVYVEVVTDSADVEQVTIPVGGTANSSAQLSAAKAAPMVPGAKIPRRTDSSPHQRPKDRPPKIVKPGVGPIAQ